MRRTSAALALAGAAALPLAAHAVPYYWVDWVAANPGAGTAAGVITPSSGAPVGVTFEARTATGPGTFHHAELSGSGYWNPAGTYTSSQVDNAPPGDILQLVGNTNMTYTVTLSEAIKDPVMAITTLGAHGDSATYVFDSPFTILSQGPTCCWGTGTLEQVGTTLVGKEGAGVIQFIGTYSTFSWTVPDPEFWHGFTFGIRTTEALEPTVTPVPEPETYAMLIAGLGLLGFWARRRKLAETA